MARIFDSDGDGVVTKLLDPRAAQVGLEGGLLATCTLTLSRMPITRSLPPTAEFWAKYVAGGDPEEYPIQAMVLHFLYGALGGCAFGVAFGAVQDRIPFGPEAAGLAFGTVASVPFSLFGSRVVLKRGLGMSLDADEELMFHAGHVVYGITIGGWLGSRK